MAFPARSLLPFVILLLSCPILFSEVNKEAKPVQVYFVGQAPPQFFIDEDKVSGFMFDAVEKSFQNVHHEVKFLVEPWARAQVDAIDKDTVIVMVKSDQRQVDFNFSKAPIFQNVQKLFRIHDGAKVPLKSSKVALIRAYKYGVNLDIEEKNQIVVNSFEQGFALLKIKRVDYILGDELVVPCMARKENLELASDYTVGKTDVFLARSKKFSKDILDEFENGFKALPKNFVAKKIAQYEVRCGQLK